MTVAHEMKTIPRAHAVLTEYSADIEPEIVVDVGERCRVETNDNFFNLVANEGDKPLLTLEPIAARQYIRGNPLAGPIYVNGVEPGDTLIVSIEEIAIRDWGWTGTIDGFGPLAGLSEWHDIDEPFGTIVRHEPGPSGTLADGEAIMNIGREVRWPLAPFIGTIVTAPERGSENSLVGQGPWGGNIDTRDIATGNKIHLNATHPGGLLFMGDVHASQGDSELTGIADETAADITVVCDVVKGKVIPGVCRIEKPDSIVQVDSARNAGSVERAINSCFLNMIRWLADDYGLDRREAYLHMTANSLVRVNVYQSTTGFFTCGVEFPRRYL